MRTDKGERKGKDGKKLWQGGGRKTILLFLEQIVLLKEIYHMRLSFLCF